MEFKKAKSENIDEICGIIKNAVAVMEKQGIHQWDEIYPTRDDFINDLNAGELFIGTQNGKTAVVFVINKCQDEAYFSADWTYRGENFAVIHRLCVNPDFQNQGVAKKTLVYIEEKLKSEKVESIRLDVFSENPYALRLYEKAGWHKTGTADWRKGRFLLMEKAL